MLLKITMLVTIAIVTCVFMAAEAMLRNDDGDSLFFKGGIAMKWVQVLIGIAGGCFVALAIQFGPTLNLLAPLIIWPLAAIAVMVGLFLWWNNDNIGGSEWVEMIPFVVLYVIFSLTVGIFTSRILELYEFGKFGTSILQAAPWMLMIFFIGISIFALLDFKEKHVVEEEKKGGFKGWKIAALILTLAAVVLLPGCGYFAQAKETPEPEPVVAEPVKVETPAPAPAPKPEPEWVFHHDGVILDNYDEFGNELTGDALKLAKLNDFDFGLDPVIEMLLDKVEAGEIDDQVFRDIAEKKLKAKDFTLEDIANKSVREIYQRLVSSEEVYQKVGGKEFEKMVSPKEVVEWLKNAMREDPSLAASVIAGYDVTMHTDFLGDYMVNYEGKEEKWMKLINGTAEMWSEDQDVFNEDLDEFFVYLDHMEPGFSRVSSGIKDQMYMLGLIPEEMPEVIVMETDQDHGLFLVFTESVKGNTKQFALRTNCGFQLSNVGKLFDVTPRKNPNKPTPSGKPSGGPDKGGKSSGGGDGKSSGGPEITNPKDITKGTPVGKNDTKGPGPDTNNPKDPQHSTRDLPTNSGYMETVAEYHEAIQDIKDANEHTRVGGDPNTPSTPTPADTTVHSNADKGTGYGGIDVATPISESVTGTELDKNGSETNVHDTVKGEVGQQWEGPSDGN